MLRSLTVAAVLSSACGTAPPRPARLDPSHAASIQVGTVGGTTGFCPGGSAPQLDVTVATTDGKVLDSWSRGEDRAGKLPFATTFEWTASWGSVDSDGYVVLPPDPIDALDREVKVEVRITERPDLAGAIALTPDFGCGGSLGAAGPTGDGGPAGDSGGTGRPGGNDDGQHGAAAGERGGSARRGGDAGPGGPGPRVEAVLAYVTTASGRRFAALRTTANGEVSTTIFDPTGERWAVVAFGGSGGSGGSGGFGGQGGQGGNGRNPPSCSSSSSDSSGSGSGSGSSSSAPACDPGTDGAAGGDGGEGGDGGSGGDGGPGGSIELVYDVAFPELADLVLLDTRGGAAGGGGYGGNGGYGGRGGSGARSGYEGRNSSSGRQGPSGRDGQPGPAPVSRGGDVRKAVADLEARGLTLAKPGR